MAFESVYPTFALLKVYGIGWKIPVDLFFTFDTSFQIR
jgi:hypothetical protein